MIRKRNKGKIESRWKRILKSYLVNSKKKE